jgi:hypothetical protein
MDAACNDTDSSLYPPVSWKISESDCQVPSASWDHHYNLPTFTLLPPRHTSTRLQLTDNSISHTPLLHHFPSALFTLQDLQDPHRKTRRRVEFCVMQSSGLLRRPIDNNPDLLTIAWFCSLLKPDHSFALPHSIRPPPPPPHFLSTCYDTPVYSSEISVSLRDLDYSASPETVENYVANLCLSFSQESEPWNGGRDFFSRPSRNASTSLDLTSGIVPGVQFNHITFSEFHAARQASQHVPVQVYSEGVAVGLLDGTSPLVSANHGALTNINLYVTRAPTLSIVISARDSTCDFMLKLEPCREKDSGIFSLLMKQYYDSEPLFRIGVRDRHPVSGESFAVSSLIYSILFLSDRKHLQNVYQGRRRRQNQVICLRVPRTCTDSDKQDGLFKVNNLF